MQEPNIRQKRVMIYFIEAAEKLMKEEGLGGLSIRKIASEAGYNSATLYNYFQDLEHLVLFASIRYLGGYVKSLEAAIKPGMNALEIYRVIYQEFSKTSFQYPELFYNMFFGRYSDKLDKVLRQYYELFPGELGEVTGFVRDMLRQGNIYQRDMAYMDALIAEGFVRKENAEATVQVVVRTHQSFIYEAWMRGDSLDRGAHAKRFMELFDYIMEMAGACRDGRETPSVDSQGT